MTPRMGCDRSYPSQPFPPISVASLWTDCSIFLQSGAPFTMFTVTLLCSYACRRDAKLLPGVTRVSNPYEPAPSSAAPEAELGVNDVKDASGNGLSEEWQSTFLRRFKGFREVRALLQTVPGGTLTGQRRTSISRPQEHPHPRRPT